MVPTCGATGQGLWTVMGERTWAPEKLWPGGTSAGAALPRESRLRGVKLRIPQHPHLADPLLPSAPTWAGVAGVRGGGRLRHVLRTPRL